MFFFFSEAYLFLGTTYHQKTTSNGRLLVNLTICTLNNLILFCEGSQSEDHKHYLFWKYCCAPCMIIMFACKGIKRILGFGTPPFSLFSLPYFMFLHLKIGKS